jgi:hypothetical protein
MRKAGAVLLVCAAMVGCGKGETPMPAVALSREYKDRAAADAKFKGQTLTISGTIDYVGDTIFLPKDYVCVSVGEGEGRAWEGVDCVFSPSSARQTKWLKKGDRVVIRGVCKGEVFVGLPELVDCSVR